MLSEQDGIIIAGVKRGLSGMHAPAGFSRGTVVNLIDIIDRQQAEIERLQAREMELLQTNGEIALYFARHLDVKDNEIDRLKAQAEQPQASAEAPAETSREELKRQLTEAIREVERLYQNGASGREDSVEQAKQQVVEIATKVIPQGWSTTIPFMEGHDLHTAVMNHEYGATWFNFGVLGPMKYTWVELSSLDSDFSELADAWREAHQPSAPEQPMTCTTVPLGTTVTTGSITSSGTPTGTVYTGDFPVSAMFTRTERGELVPERSIEADAPEQPTLADLIPIAVDPAIPDNVGLLGYPPVVLETDEQAFAHATRIVRVGALYSDLNAETREIAMANAEIEEAQKRIEQSTKRAAEIRVSIKALFPDPTW